MLPHLRGGSSLLFAVLPMFLAFGVVDSLHPEVPYHHIAAPTPKPRERTDGATAIFNPLRPGSAEQPTYAGDGSGVLFTLFSEGFQAGSTTIDWGEWGKPPRELLDSSLGAETWHGRSWIGRFAVVTSSKTGTSELWLMDTRAAALAQITTHATGDVYTGASISPNGQWIVFAVAPPSDGGADSASLAGTIWKVRPDGTSLTQLTPGQSAGFSDSEPQWAPDGQSIVFCRSSQTNSAVNLAIMAADGSNVVMLTKDQVDDLNPAWSPDGQSIAYSSTDAEGTSASIYLISPQGGTPVKLTSADGYADIEPSWSPDGSTIVYASHPMQTADGASIWQIAVTTKPTPGSLPVVLPSPTDTPTPTDQLPPDASLRPDPGFNGNLSPSPSATPTDMPTDTPTPIDTPTNTLSGAQLCATPTPSPTDTPSVTPTPGPCDSPLVDVSPTDTPMGTP